MKMQSLQIAGIMTTKQAQATDKAKPSANSFKELLFSQWPGATLTQGSDGAKVATQTMETETNAADPVMTEATAEANATGTKETKAETESTVTQESKPLETEQGEEKKNLEETDEQALLQALAAAMPPPVIMAVNPESEEETPLVENVTLQPIQSNRAAPVLVQESEAVLSREETQPVDASAAGREKPIRQTAGADIVSAEVVVPESQETPESTVAGKSAYVNAIPDPGQAQDRFDQLVSQAAKELQSVQENLQQQQTVETEEPIPQQDDTIQPTATTPETPEMPEIPTDGPSETLKTTEATEAQETPETTEAPERPQTAQARIERAISRRTARTEEYVAQTIENPVEITPKPAAATSTESVRQAFAPPPEEQITAKVVENLETQKMEFNMQLRPKELGEIDVRMVMESGKLAVYIVAAAPKTVEALQKQSDGLIVSLRMANIQVESVQIVQQAENKENYMDGAFNMFSHQSGGEEQQHAGHSGGHNKFTGDEQSESENETSQKPERLLDTAV